MSERSHFASLRNAFFTGLLLLAPLAVTVVVFEWMVEQVGGSFRGVFFWWVPDRWLNEPGLGLVWNILSSLIVALFTTGLGIVSRWVLGKYFGALAERMILAVPGVNAVYNTVKQIVQTFSAENRAAFSKVVLVPFPTPGAWAVGFLTNERTGEPAARTGQALVSVFIPTTPNPTSGFLVMFPRASVTELEMSVRDAMKLVISGGSVFPGAPPASAPPAPPEPPAAAAAVAKPAGDASAGRDGR